MAAQQQSAAEVVVAFTKCATLYGVLAISNYAAQLALHPLFGATTTSNHFRALWAGLAIVISMCPGSLLPLKSYKLVPRSLGLMSLLFSAAPVTLYKWGGFAARYQNQRWSPLAAQLALTVPVVLLGVTMARSWLVSFFLARWVFLLLILDYFFL